jgi:hypothetical protein
MQYITQLALIHSTRAHTYTRSREREQLYLQSHFVKERRGSGGSGWIRTIDPRLIKTVL